MAGFCCCNPGIVKVDGSRETNLVASALAAAFRLGPCSCPKRCHPTFRIGIRCAQGSGLVDAAERTPIVAHIVEALAQMRDLAQYAKGSRLNCMQLDAFGQVIMRAFDFHGAQRKTALIRGALHWSALPRPGVVAVSVSTLPPDKRRGFRRTLGKRSILHCMLPCTAFVDQVTHPGCFPGHPGLSRHNAYYCNWVAGCHSAAIICAIRAQHWSDVASSGWRLDRVM